MSFSVISTACSGDYSDFQRVSEELKKEWHSRSVYGKSEKADPEEFAQYLAAMCYSKRSQSDPFFIEGILAGVKDGVKTLTCVDLYGNKYSDKYLTTSFTRMISVPIIDATYNENMTAVEVRAILVESFKVMLARNKTFGSSLVFVLVTENGIFEEKQEIQVRYDYDGFKNREDLF